MAKTSMGKLFLITFFSTVLPFFILGIPAWIYLGLGSPDDKFWLLSLSLGLYGFFILIGLILLIYQAATNSSIENSKLWKLIQKKLQ